ncbi:MAG: prenyltransferase/squalene oxidase repeat-containing protein [Planctomycetota bacterium]
MWVGRSLLVAVALAGFAHGQDPALPPQSAKLAPEITDSADEADAELRERCFAAADRALAWLAAQQGEHGEFQGDVGQKMEDEYIVYRSAQDNRVLGQGHIGLSSLAGMAFLAGGHLPGRGTYGENVRKVVDYVIAHTTESGYVTDGGTRMYSHAFATLFLAEVNGMTPDNRLRDALDRAVRLIVDCQNAQGGWRYNPFATDADMSVTVCQLQALRAAHNIGIRVPKSTIDAAVAFVMRARSDRGSDRGLYYYKTQGRGAWTKNREYAINAAAATALLSAGIHDDELHAPTLDWLDRSYGSVSRWFPTHYYYWYGNYYACQAFFQAGGERFRNFERRIQEDLLARQESDGRFRNDTGPGDVFATAVAALILQIDKQYLPIFQR